MGPRMEGRDLDHKASGDRGQVEEKSPEMWIVDYSRDVDSRLFQRCG